MTTLGSCTGHSAVVKMRLCLPGATLKIAQMGPDYFILSEAASHPPCDATIRVWVDGSESMSQVYLPHGISPDVKKVEVAHARNLVPSGS
jgi:hypothetical protein